MTREDIIRMYEKANGWSPEGWDKTVNELEKFAALVAAAEREACAKVCENGTFLHEFSPEAKYSRACARSIRERGQG